MEKQCIYQGCNHIACFGFPVEKIPKFCKDHRTGDMVYFKYKLCEDPTCLLTAIYRSKEDTEPRFCYLHKLRGMKSVKSRVCHFPGCNKPALYGYSTILYCKDHKTDDMKNIKSTVCRYPDCINRAYYNVKGKPPLFCRLHKADNMVISCIARCIVDGCNKIACFNYPNKRNTREFLFCNVHKADGMINIRIKQCQYQGCTRRALYGVDPGDMIYCKEHKTEDMKYYFDMSKKCSIKGCDKVALYNYKGEKEAFFCREHRLSDMINVRRKTCIENGCSKFPSFNYKGCPALFCGQHKKEGMINVKKKICIEDNCNRIAKYGEKGNKKYCRLHRIQQNRITNESNNNNGIDDVINSIIDYSADSNVNSFNAIQPNDFNVFAEGDGFKEFIEQL
jgi:hypothetical protein